jgi:hypothetical protein
MWDRISQKCWLQDRLFFWQGELFIVQCMAECGGSACRIDQEHWLNLFKLLNRKGDI